MRRFFSALFSLLIFAGICAAIYFNQQFCKTQADKVVGMYYVFKGDEAYRHNKLHKAIVFYNKGLKLYPQHYSAWYNLGNLYVTYEDYYAALYAYSQAFKHNPRMIIARMNYGIIATQKLGDFDSAIKQYKQILKTKRTLISIPFVYSNKNSYKENLAIAHYNLGVTYRLKSLFANDDWDIQRKYLVRAIKSYKKSLKIVDKSYDTQYNLGLAYHIAGNWDEAGKSYCKAIKIAPLNFEAHYNMAILLRKLGRYKEAYEEIDKATTLVTALNANSATQLYASIMMNDILRSYVRDQSYKNLLKAEVEKDKENKDIRNKKKKKLENKDITSTFVKGKITAGEELDKAMTKNFSKCNYLIEEDEE